MLRIEQLNNFKDSKKFLYILLFVTQIVIDSIDFCKNLSANSR